MNYFLLPSLEQMALTKTAITLCDRIDFSAELHADPCSWRERKIILQKLEDGVIKKLQQLSLPKQLNEKIASVIRPIGIEMLGWIEYNYWCCNLTTFTPNKFYWTSQGTLDFKKSAEALIRDENLSIKTRYIIACIYCLEEDIPKLWTQLPQNVQDIFYTDPSLGDAHRFYRGRSFSLFAYHWAYEIKGELTSMNCIFPDSSVYQIALGTAIRTNNEEAIKYFCQKITPAERKECLLTLVNRHFYRYFRCRPSIVCFLLSQCDEKQEIELLKSYRISILEEFLKWPLQTWFMEVAIRTWDYHHKSSYHLILIKMVNLVMEGYRDYNYMNLFEEFWQKMPAEYKRQVISEITRAPNLLSNLLTIKSIGNFHAILQAASAKECVKIFSYSIKIDDTFYFPPLLMQAFASSSFKDIVQFVKVFKRRLMFGRSKEEMEKEEDTWINLLRKFDDYAINNNI